MKRYTSIVFLLFILMFPTKVRGEDSTLILTFKSEANHSILKSELRAGLWKKGQDGPDPLDLEAMLNGPFEVHFESFPPESVPRHNLWWDIRSSNPWQEWKIQVMSPPHVMTVVEWREVHHETGKGPVTYNILDTETGQVRELDVTSGTFSFSTTGHKTLILKSRPR